MPILVFAALVVIIGAALWLHFTGGAIGLRPAQYGTHGSRCNARAKAWTCRHCRSRVFRFTCDCGSRFLFDTLGGAWQQHACA